MSHIGPNTPTATLASLDGRTREGRLMRPRDLIDRALRRLWPALCREITRQEHDAARPMWAVPIWATHIEMTVTDWDGGGTGGISSASAACPAGQSS
ncbi:MAG: hypothetical protein ACRYGM_29460 [Janthinobacterium lividum]